MALELDAQQLGAVDKLKNGSILAADVGTGKSRTALAYYYLKECKGSLKINGSGGFHKMRFPRDLYILTTAKKRDSLEWEKEMVPLMLSDQVSVKVDSWNNIAKYRKVFGSFFIFDEQRVKGSGKWVKSFLDIVRKNKWILLSATPGDKWKDYIPVFVANGFYKNATDFKRQHIIYSPYVTKYPKIEGYMNQGILLKHRNDILVRMDVKSHTIRHDIPWYVSYDRNLYHVVWKRRWDPYDDCPIEETGKLLYLLRKVVNLDDSRLEALCEIDKRHRKVIVFYNYTYELEALREFYRGRGYDIGEWNGQVHSDIPKGEKWAYLVQYSAGCEGWNCVETNAIIFFSQSYSYSMTVQAEGRIDRRNTPFTDLYYYKLKSHAPIDIAIARALKQKENFNKDKFLETL